FRSRNAKPDASSCDVGLRIAPLGFEPRLSRSLTTSAFAAARAFERSWSGLCLHLRPYAVRWLPPSLYTFPSRGLARRCQSRVRRLRERSRTSFPAWRPASAPSGAARVRRVASYTKGQYAWRSGVSFYSRALSKSRRSNLCEDPREAAL